MFSLSVLIVALTFSHSSRVSNANTANNSFCDGNLCSVEWWKKASSKDVDQELNKNDLKAFFKKNHSSIFSAISLAGRWKGVKVFLERGGKEYINRVLHGWTPISEIVKFRTDEEVIKLIHLYVSYGAKLNFTPFGAIADSRLPPKPGFHVLSGVLSYGDKRPLSLKTKIVETLLELGANPREGSPFHQRTVLGLACSEVSWPLAKIMIEASPGFKWSEVCGLPQFEKGKNVRCGHFAMINFHDKVVDQALSGLKREGFSVKTFPASSQGNTLLHYATSLGSVNTMKKLIREGADIKFLNNKGQSPQHLLKKRLRHYKAAKEDEELLNMMKVSLPISTKIKNFF